MQPAEPKKNYTVFAKLEISAARRLLSMGVVKGPLFLRSAIAPGGDSISGLRLGKFYLTADGKCSFRA